MTLNVKVLNYCKSVTLLINNNLLFVYYILDCGCNLKASSSDVCDSTTGQCNCTESAIGLQCMDCPDTHFTTTGSDQNYCMECFCFNHSTSCVGVEGYYLNAMEDRSSQMFSNNWTNIGIEINSAIIR